ncbi:LysR substrate-binding domain-containing protein [Alisedimentitalea sp. MJ-SS2]|uniref:LysR substrate-binding domain-containing protein n=1 Tax=Aliisedimentitalea sp. MJ-SS2 TaxID=3049795 RepID=UPI00290F3136|nr:LysR substrate-binding domain-containing protein [Alisedimentitalea sp. MJ-SS2]MDU8928082.1 LysR substrate-binding domain-containing protein [Alisedimentitalea sp. MJ-SS2]
MELLDWTKLPSLTSLKAFEAAARAESFSAAARSLNVTHAAVAQQVKSLEEHLGVQLLQRSPSGVAVTPDGRDFAESLRAGFAIVAEAVRAVGESDGNRPIRITTTAFFAEAVIFPRIASFWSKFPDTEISFSSSDDIVDIVAEGFDLAIRASDKPWPDLSCHLLLESPTRALAAPSLVDDPKTDWNNLPWLIPDDSQWEREALRQSGIDTNSITTKDLGNPSLEVRAGEEGMGIVLESELDVRSQLLQGSLKVAPIKITHISGYYVVTPPWKPRASVQLFIDWLMHMGRTIST